MLEGHPFFWIHLQFTGFPLVPSFSSYFSVIANQMWKRSLHSTIGKLIVNDKELKGVLLLREEDCFIITCCQYLMGRLGVKMLLTHQRSVCTETPLHLLQGLITVTFHLVTLSGLSFILFVYGPERSKNVICSQWGLEPDGKYKVICED